MKLLMIKEDKIAISFDKKIDELRALRIVVDHCIDKNSITGAGDIELLKDFAEELEKLLDYLE